MWGLQDGLSKAAHFETGRTTVPYCGSMATVRSSRRFCQRLLILFSDFAAGAGKSILWYVSSRLIP